MINVTDRGASQSATASENTTIIQSILNTLPGGETVLIPAGCNLKIDAAIGLRPKNGAIIQVDGTLQTVTKPGEDFCRLFYLGNGVNSITIQGQGTLRGDRDTHVGNESDSGATGYCIEITSGATNTTVKGVTCTNAWADGICVGGVPHDDPRRSKNLILDGVRITNNRRNGFSAIDLDGLHITNCQILSNGVGARSTPPRFGIDLECDSDTMAVMNVIVEHTVFNGNGDTNVGIGGRGTYKNIFISSTNVYDWTQQPIATTGNAGALGTSASAFLANRMFSWWSGYRYWGYKNEWRSPF